MVLHWIRRAVWVLAVVWVAPRVEGYYEYQARLPNGNRIPHPCKSNFMWPGVGHLNVQGGGARNLFGLDFAAAGRSWTEELCRKDSDGDGQSNGEELGDPQCIWTPGQVPQSTKGITHPGVCDPFDSAECSRQSVPRSMGVSFETVGEWMKEACETADFECPAKDGDDVQRLEFRLPATPVPAKETTYMCMTFEWPDATQDFHVIATEPIINNTNIMHHILLFGCLEKPSRESPWECDMVGCTDLLSSWGVGVLGQCFHPDAGLLVGRTGHTNFMMQLHWNNPQLHDHLTDSSGMTLHYTSRLRPYNLAMLMTGQNFIHIPPRSPDTFVTSDCTSACTRALMTGDIKITGVLNHMHYLGKSMNIELHRCGRFMMNITNDLVYSYDSPKFYQFQDVLTVKPGDMIRTNCHFSSLNKATSTFFGLGTSDEMCYGFLSFYPKENMPDSFFCASWKGYIDCDEESDGECSRERRKMFSRPTFSQTDLFQNITSNCKLGLCTEECKTAVRTARKCDPCLNNQVSWDMLHSFHLPSAEHGWRFAASLAVCQTQLDRESVTHPHLADNIVCPENGTPDLITPKPEPAYNDTCNAGEHSVTLERTAASAVKACGWALGETGGLALGTLCLILRSR